jgi:hypothetical protein
MALVSRDGGPTSPLQRQIGLLDSFHGPSPEEGGAVSFRRDLLIVVLLGILLTATMAGFQSVGPTTPTNISLSEMPMPKQDKDDSISCSDLDHAYNSC